MALIEDEKMKRWREMKMKVGSKQNQKVKKLSTGSYGLLIASCVTLRDTNWRRFKDALRLMSVQRRFVNTKKNCKQTNI